MKWLEIDQNNLHMKSSASSIDFGSLSFNPLSSGGLCTRAINRGTPIKIGYFSVKTVADKHRRAAYHNKHWLRAVLGYLP